MKKVIAIDGPAASGKGTLARKLAATLNYAHLDTGAIYRIAALYLAQQNLVFNGENCIVAARYVRDALPTARFDNPALRTDKIGSLTSRLSAIPAVRDILMETQRHFAYHPPSGFNGAVLDGRDIGTVVCPDADVKFFITADMRTRARRRFEELQARGFDATFETVMKDMEERDFRDTNRDIAPLKPAADSVTLDTSVLTPDAALEQALAVIRAKLPA